MEKKHLLFYLEQVFMVFGASLLAITLITALLGDEARGYSTMFALGSRGIPLHTVGEYLLSSVCVTALRFVYFTDTFIKSWSLTGRTVGMLVSVIGLTGGLSYLFGWFPVNDPKSVLAFLVSFGICFLIAAALSGKKEQVENRQLEEALRRMKESEK